MSFRLSCIFALSLLAFGLNRHQAVAQENDSWVPDSIKSSVTDLLKKYEFYHNSLTSNSDSDQEIAFIRLFANPKILVLSDYAGDSAIRRISIQDYSASIIENFPKGVTVKLLFSSLIVGKPHFDRNDRYILKARINQSKTGISFGKVITSTSTVIFRIAFTWTGDRTTDFEIYGIDEAPVQQNVLGIDAGPALSVLSNSDIAGDARFGLMYRPGYQFTFHYSHYFDSHWGVSAGIRYAQIGSVLTLDSIDPYGGFNPGFSDVVFSNRLWTLSVPMLLSWQHRFNKRWSAYADAGPMISLRLFETQQVSGYSESRGKALDNIISDPAWVSEMNRLWVSFCFDAGLLLQINPTVRLGAGIGINQGLTSLDHGVQYNYDNARYLGQFNPLWGSDMPTLVRSAALNIRMTFTLKNESER